jgi:hypothetical protein
LTSTVAEAVLNSIGLDGFEPIDGLPSSHPLPAAAPRSAATGKGVV